MTDQTPTANTPAPPKPKRTRKQTFSVKDMATARLKRRGKATSAEAIAKESKSVRGALRIAHGDLKRTDASIRKNKPVANDNTPWPTDMNATTFDRIVNGAKAKGGK